MLAAELKSIPKRLKIRLKNEIHNCVFKYQEIYLQEMENNHPTFGNNQLNAGRFSSPPGVTPQNVRSPNIANNFSPNMSQCNTW